MQPLGRYTLETNINKYLKTKKRTSQLILFIADLHNQISNPQKTFSFLKTLTKGLKSPLKILKILTLINQIILTSSALKYDDINLLIAQISMRERHKDQFENYLKDKIIRKYMSYLQKRAFYQQNMQQRKKMVCEQKEEAYIAESYKIINLLNEGLSFHDTMFILGRYFSQKYWSLVDFNLILGMDFRELYCQLKSKIQMIEPHHQLRDEYENLILEIENIHEKMNSIYYNIYHYKVVKAYAPIKIDTNAIEISPKYKNSDKQLISSAQKNFLNTIRTRDQSPDLQNLQAMQVAVKSFCEEQNHQAQQNISIKSLQGQSFTQQLCISILIESPNERSQYSGQPRTNNEIISEFVLEEVLEV